jgi:thioredoxin 1
MMDAGNNGKTSKFKRVKIFVIIIVAVAGFICVAQMKSPCASSGGLCFRSATSGAPSRPVPAKTAAKAEKKVEAKLPQLLDLGAKKCIPCKKMAPILDGLEKEYKGILIVKFIDVWVKENAAEAKKYEISSIPTQIFFDKEGKELWRHVGFISKEDILKKWKELGYNLEELKKKSEKKPEKKK